MHFTYSVNHEILVHKVPFHKIWAKMTVVTTLDTTIAHLEYQVYIVQSVPMKNNDEIWDVLRKVFTNIKQKE